MSAKHASSGGTASPNQAPRRAQPQSTQTRDGAQAQASTQTRDAFFAVFAWRLLNAFCVRTFFQPDEYFQALEPAWQLAFGQGQGAWLTWEWQYKLRSSLHPAIFAIGYFVVDNSIGGSGSGKAAWLLAAPKVIQAGLAALGDWLSWRLAGKLYGNNPAVVWSVLFMTLANPWQWFTSTRAFSNCLEATLTCSALYYWPWELLAAAADDEKAAPEATLFKTWSSVNSLRLSLLSAALAVLLRPTNALLWFALGTVVLTRLTLDGKSPLTWRVVLILSREIIICGSLALGLCLIADRQYYGEWTFPPLNLVYFNVSQDLAVFYGENDWHYYLSQGIPLLSTTLLPFVLTGLYKSTDPSLVSSWSVTTSNSIRALTYMVTTMVSSLSFISHKEVRFITPLLPILHILAAPHVTKFFTTAMETAGACPAPVLGWKRKPLIALGLAANVIVGGYLASFHAAAPIGVMTFLREQFEAAHPEHLDVPLRLGGPGPGRRSSLSPEPPGDLFAYFLTPCHATPWRSHLVYPALRADALSCDPPVLTEPRSAARAAYRDETSRFYADEAAGLRALWPADAPARDIPRYIVAYEGMEAALSAHFATDGPGARDGVRLRKVWSAWNGLFTDDDRKAGHLEVWTTGLREGRPALSL